MGTTSIVYHLAWMFADLGVRVAALDFDPQADLTAMLKGEEPAPFRLAPAALEMVLVEDGKTNDRFTATLAELSQAPSPPELVLVDVGPGFGGLERAALHGSDHVIIPATPESRAIQGMEVLGVAIREGKVSPQMAGYIVLQHGWLNSAAVNALLPLQEIAAAYPRLPDSGTSPGIAEDPDCLGRLRHYRSLAPMAAAAGKPMFHLTPVDGAIGTHVDAVLSVRADFARLARRIAAKVGVEVPGD